MAYVTAILKIKTTLPAAAQEALTVFGEGGNPSATQVEEFIGIVNTPETNGYVRILTTPEFATALEQIAAGPGSQNADLVRVEWDGQQPFVCGQDEEQNDILLGGIMMQH